MSWTRLLARRLVERHATSKNELDNVRALIKRDLADASITGVSADRRFATAYNAALQSSKMAVACAGYRLTSRPGHHETSFEAAKLVLGKQAAAFTDYLDTCRRKRNRIDYFNCNVATDSEAEELVHKARDFHAMVETWIVRNHPKLKG